ncbi:MAG: VCBS repeat-containing protein, partial [Verrucomicrobiales bacterium]|nr:VCBS repeat-containing protein [Verrucomicrobiales bacterium]
ADYNNDGLLDFYLTTYRPATLGDADSPSGGDGGKSPTWPDEFLEPDTASEYYRRHELYKAANPSGLPQLLDQLGPPNILYVNRGNGRFEPAPENQQIGLWKNSLQATWADYDNDGDPDLYVANDWSPDNFYRNDGADGFSDITTEIGTTAFGFAMGASFGDYDHDGRQDLYVSNMFSKAGNRIIDRLPEIEPAYLESAAGNYLYKQTGDRFQLVSGLTPQDIPVAKGGWGWGGQFADFDNDSFLDIYSLSGYFTAPRRLASQLDL